MISLEGALLLLALQTLDEQPAFDAAVFLQSTLRTSLYNKFDIIRTSEILIIATIYDPIVKL